MADNALQPGAAPANPDVRHRSDYEILRLPMPSGGEEVLFLAPMTSLHRAAVKGVAEEKAKAQLGIDDTMPNVLDPCGAGCLRCSFACRANMLLLKNLDELRIESARKRASAGGRC